MTWSYSPDQIATNPVYQVRFMIGDTVNTDQQLQDEEIAFQIKSRSTVTGAAAECCRSLAAKFGRSVDRQASGFKTSYSQMAKAYTQKAMEFDALAAKGGAGIPYAGGISVADKQKQDQDPDRVKPQFNIGIMDSDYPVPPVGNEDEETTEGRE